MPRQSRATIVLLALLHLPAASSSSAPSAGDTLGDERTASALLRREERGSLRPVGVHDHHSKGQEEDASLAASAWTPWKAPDGSSTALSGWEDTTTLPGSSDGSTNDVVCPPTCTPEQLGENQSNLDSAVLNMSDLNFTNETNDTWWTTTEPPDDYELNYVDSNKDPNEDVDGGGWVLVRHTSGEYPTWGPWDDNLQGTEPVNDAAGPQAATHWSLDFSELQMEEIMFATADGLYWLITDPIEVKGSNYANLSRTIYKSSQSNKPYKVNWFNRVEVPQDPLVTLDGANVLYAEANSTEGVQFKNEHGGANVYFRKRGADAGGAPEEEGPRRRPKKPRRRKRKFAGRAVVAVNNTKPNVTEAAPVEKPEVNDSNVTWYRGYEAGSDDESEGIRWNVSSSSDANTMS